MVESKQQVALFLSAEGLGMTKCNIDERAVKDRLKDSELNWGIKEGFQG